MPDFKPSIDIQINEFIKIADKSWPKGYYREISELDKIKEFYNSSYENFHTEIETLLGEFHPAAWVRIAYTQLELWTLELFEANHKNRDITKAPYLFIPIGRYGWRYILEISLEKLMNYNNESFNDSRPSDIDISKIFTFLIGLSYSNEISNYLHYLKDHFQNANLIFSNTLYAKFPFIQNSEEDLFLKKIMSYLNDGTDLNLVPEFDYRSNLPLLERINSLLLKHFKFTINDIDTISEILRNKITPKIKASNLIIPTNELVVLLVRESNLNVEIIINIVNFIFFDTQYFNYKKRNFLQKSQNIRMLNFAGCKFKLDNNLKTIYDDTASEWVHIKLSEHHCIISFLLVEEWKLNFISRLIYGQREDLKNLSKELKNDISKIEQYFHRNIFESAIKNLMIKHGQKCISLDKINKIKITCGEIDGLSIDSTNKIIYVIEAKNTSPAKDARAFGKIISDHYEQKKYHEKFLLKINWVENNIDELSIIFKTPITKDFTVEKYFVTGSPNPLKFLIKDYNILTYFEFYNLLNKRYEKNKP